jgi:hypothetical protein
MAVAILNMFPSARHLARLACAAFGSKKRKALSCLPVAVAILEAVVGLPADNCEKLRAALATAKRLALELKGDPARLNVLSRAEQELLRKCGTN